MGIKLLPSIQILLILFTSACSFSSKDNMSLEEVQRKVATAGMPSVHHEKLEALKGSWKAKSKFWPSPDSTPLESTGFLRRGWTLGNRFLKEEYQDFNAKHPFIGVGYIGYDNVKDQYVATWLDTMGTGIYNSSGEFNEENSSFSFKGSSPSPLTGKNIKSEAVIKVLDVRKHIYEMYHKQNGERFKVLEITYEKH